MLPGITLCPSLFAREPSLCGSRVAIRQGCPGITLRPLSFIASRSGEGLKERRGAFLLGQGERTGLQADVDDIGRSNENPPGERRDYRSEERRVGKECRL